MEVAMVKDTLVKRLFELHASDPVVSRIASKAGMDRKTAKKYLQAGKLPSELGNKTREYRTRQDPFADVWDRVEEKLRLDPSLKPVTLFGWLTVMAAKDRVDRSRATARWHLRDSDQRASRGTLDQRCGEKL